MRVGAKPFAYWIPPDVAGDILYLLVRPHDVVIEPHLPQPRTTVIPKLVGGVLFEGVDKPEQIRAIGETLTKQVNVIRHDAIGVERKVLLGGDFQ